MPGMKEPARICAPQGDQAAARLVQVCSCQRCPHSACIESLPVLAPLREATLQRAPPPHLPAGVDIINAHGRAAFQPMLQLFERYLDRKSVRDEASYDKVREGAIVFLGTLARHLDPADPKVRVSLAPCLSCVQGSGPAPAPKRASLAEMFAAV